MIKEYEYYSRLLTSKSPKNMINDKENFSNQHEI